MNRQFLPYFVDEPSGIGTLLDYILVDWPYPLKYMIRTRRRRSLLRRFVEDALHILECAYSRESHNTFQSRLRTFWSRRARIFYDDRNVRLPYITHIYTMNYTVPHMHGDTNGFVNRITVHLRERNPQVTEPYVEEIINIHAVDPFSNGNQSNVFSIYELRGMSSSEHYLEEHVIQFYRILFFFLELQARGINTDEDDRYEGPLPYIDVPEEVQAIVYNDSVYRDYLLRRRRNELVSIDDNPYRQNLESSARAREEDLIMLFRTRIKNLLKTSTTSVTTAKSTATPETMSTTPNYLQRSKKGGVYMNIQGKHFSKEQEKFVDICDENNNQEFDKKGYKNFADSLNEGQIITHGYIDDSCKHEQLIRPNEGLFFIKTLQFILSDTTTDYEVLNMLLTQ